MEDLSISPVTKKILGLAGGFSFGWPFDQVLSKVREHMGFDSVERIKLLLETIKDELRKHDQKIGSLRAASPLKIPQALLILSLIYCSMVPESGKHTR